MSDRLSDKRIQSSLSVLLGLAALLMIFSCSAPSGGPLRVSDKNPRYFTDGSGKAILLTGSHTWNNLVDMGPSDPPLPFDFDAYLLWMQNYGHNFMRLWTWESMNWNTTSSKPQNGSWVPEIHMGERVSWGRAGQGMSWDGKQ
jgi:hypothetical protein